MVCKDEVVFGFGNFHDIKDFNSSFTNKGMVMTGSFEIEVLFNYDNITEKSRRLALKS